MWKAAFSHEILLDCTVNTLHVRSGNTAYQNCLIVRHFTCRNPLSCSERWLRRASTFFFISRLEWAVVTNFTFPYAIFAIFSWLLSEVLLFQVQICSCITNEMCRFYILIYNRFFIVFTKYMSDTECLKWKLWTAVTSIFLLSCAAFCTMDFFCNKLAEQVRILKRHYAKTYFNIVFPSTSGVTPWRFLTRILYLSLHVVVPQTTRCMRISSNTTMY
jgi:hypothetical protein